MLRGKAHPDGLRGYISGVGARLGAEETNDAVDLLNKVKGTYSSLKSFRFEGDTVMESQGVGVQTKMDFPFEGDFAAPNKMRIEMKSPLMPILLVSDGRMDVDLLAGNQDV